MDIEMQLNVPVDYFFNRLIESVLYDIHAQTGKTVRAAQLPNFTYRKKLANGNTGHLTVTEYRAGGVYAYKMKTGRNQYHVRYQVTAAEDQTTRLAYKEEMVGATSTVTANNRLTGFMLGWFRKRRFKKMAAEIARDYEQTRLVQ